MRSSNFYGNDQYYNQNRADQRWNESDWHWKYTNRARYCYCKLGSYNRSKNIETAQRENIIISNRVIDKLGKEIGVLRKDIQTSIYNIEPQYDYIEGKQIFRNYKVTNIFYCYYKEYRECRGNNRCCS